MKFFVIDGNSLMNRAFYGVRILSNKKGVCTNAIFGFMNIYLKNIKELKPDAIITAFDLKSPTFRHKASETYKANRKGMDDSLAMQMPYIKKILEYMGTSVLSCEGYEADDILGTIADICTKTGNECHILTGDRDSLQLINENVTVHLATNRDTIPYTQEKFEEEYGYPPINLIDFKGLRGDSSDNISGVKGIGDKTATALIQKWHTVENIYENFDNLEVTKSVKTKLENGKKDAEFCKWLATIVKDVPIDRNPENYILKPQNDEKLCEILVELEMTQLIDKLGLGQKAGEILAKTAVLSENEEKIERKIEKLGEEKNFSEISAEIKQNSEEKVYYLFENGILSVNYKKNLYVTSDKEEILEFFESDVKKATFSAKLHYRYAFRNGKKLKNIVSDGEISGYLLNPAASEYTIKGLCSLYGITCEDENYSDIEALPVLTEVLDENIDKSDMRKLLDEIELPLTEVLASMEHYGVKTDRKGVSEFGEYLRNEIENIQQEIYESVGHEFNILSPKQLGVVLFEELGLPVKKKTKTGYSTNVDVLNELKNAHPVVEKVLKYRQYSKLISTYVDGLMKEIESDGRIHTCYKQSETRTGRISSTEPNLQNIPVRTELGRNMRKFFIAEDGCTLVDADYSQIELRVLANICDDKNMQETFLSGQDIHTSTAAQIMGLPEELVTPSMRSAAKAINFGIIYGMGAFSLSKDIHVSVAEAKKYIENYLSHYPNVTKFMDKTVEDATKNGFVKTYFGRIRPVPELASKNKMLQAAGKRVAMNTPVQGTAADIIKKAMICVYKRLEKEVPQAKLILQIHDELIVETPVEYEEKVKNIVTEEMQNVCKMAVPLIADAHCGKSWYDAKG